MLVISQDLDEIEEIADRIAVIFHGTLSEPMEAAKSNRETLGLLMGGSKGKAAAEQGIEQGSVSHAAGA